MGCHSNGQGTGTYSPEKVSLVLAFGLGFVAARFDRCLQRPECARRPRLFFHDTPFILIGEVKFFAWIFGRYFCVIQRTSLPFGQRHWAQASPVKPKKDKITHLPAMRSSAFRDVTSVPPPPYHRLDVDLAREPPHLSR
jgi:hypothetical protein